MKKVYLSKEPAPDPIIRLVQGDTDTQIITFRVPQFAGGVDLKDHEWSVLFHGEHGQHDVSFIGKGELHGSLIEFNWTVPSAVCKCPGRTWIMPEGILRNEDGTGTVWRSESRCIYVAPAVHAKPGEIEHVLQPYQELLSSLAGIVQDLIDKKPELEELIGRIDELEDQIPENFIDEFNTLRSQLNTALENLQNDVESGRFKGDMGPAPVRGTDYWTPADKREINRELTDYVDTILDITDEAEIEIPTMQEFVEIKNDYDAAREMIVTALTKLSQDIEAGLLDGPKGDKGDTPVRGVDYWTEDDIQAINDHIEDAAEDAVEGYIQVTDEDEVEVPSMDDLRQLESTVSLTLTNLENTKVGYSEVVNNQLLMYSDSTKAHLLATLDLPTSDAPVKGIKISGNSLIPDSNGDVEIPINATLGVGYSNSSKGFTTQKASNSAIDARTGNYAVLTPSNVDYATMKALSDPKNHTWTAEQQAASCATLGAETKVGIELLARHEIKEPTTGIYITTTTDGRPINALEFCAVVNIPQITGTTSYLNAMWKTGTNNYRNFPTAYLIDRDRAIQGLYAMEYFANRMIPRLFYGRPGGTCENPAAFGLFVPIEPIKGVYFSQYREGSELIPAGTVIEVYGRQV